MTSNNSRPSSPTLSSLFLNSLDPIPLVDFSYALYTSSTPAPTAGLSASSDVCGLCSHPLHKAAKVAISLGIPAVVLPQPSSSSSSSSSTSMSNSVSGTPMVPGDTPSMSSVGPSSMPSTPSSLRAGSPLTLLLFPKRSSSSSIPSSPDPSSPPPTTSSPEMISVLSSLTLAGEGSMLDLYQSGSHIPFDEPFTSTDHLPLPTPLPSPWSTPSVTTAFYAACRNMFSNTLVSSLGWTRLSQRLWVQSAPTTMGLSITLRIAPAQGSASFSASSLSSFSSSSAPGGQSTTPTFPLYSQASHSPSLAYPPPAFSPASSVSTPTGLAATPPVRQTMGSPPPRPPASAPTPTASSLASPQPLSLIATFNLEAMDLIPIPQSGGLDHGTPVLLAPYGAHATWVDDQPLTQLTPTGSCLTCWKVSVPHLSSSTAWTKLALVPPPHLDHAPRTQVMAPISALWRATAPSLPGRVYNQSAKAASTSYQAPPFNTRPTLDPLKLPDSWALPRAPRSGSSLLSSSSFIPVPSVTPSLPPWLASRFINTAAIAPRASPNVHGRPGLAVPGSSMGSSSSSRPASAASNPDGPPKAPELPPVPALVPPPLQSPFESSSLAQKSSQMPGQPSLKAALSKFLPQASLGAALTSLRSLSLPPPAPPSAVSTGHPTPVNHHLPLASSSHPTPIPSAPATPEVLPRQAPAPAPEATPDPHDIGLNDAFDMSVAGTINVDDFVGYVEDDTTQHPSNDDLFADPTPDLDMSGTHTDPTTNPVVSGAPGGVAIGPVSVVASQDNTLGFLNEPRTTADKPSPFAPIELSGPLMGPPSQLSVKYQYTPMTPGLSDLPMASNVPRPATAPYTGEKRKRGLAAFLSPTVPVDPALLWSGLRSSSISSYTAVTVPDILETSIKAARAAERVEAPPPSSKRRAFTAPGSGSSFFRPVASRAPPTASSTSNANPSEPSSSAPYTGFFTADASSSSKQSYVRLQHGVSLTLAIPSTVPIDGTVDALAILSPLYGSYEELHGPPGTLVEDASADASNDPVTPSLASDDLVARSANQSAHQAWRDHEGMPAQKSFATWLSDQAVDLLDHSVTGLRCFQLLQAYRRLYRGCFDLGALPAAVTALEERHSDLESIVSPLVNTLGYARAQASTERVMWALSKIQGPGRPLFTSPMSASATSLSPPRIVIGYENHWLDVEPSQVLFWDKALFEPYFGSKDIRAYVLAPTLPWSSAENSRSAALNAMGLLHWNTANVDHEAALSSFFIDLASVYNTCNLGDHSQVSGEELKFWTEPALSTTLPGVGVSAHIKETLEAVRASATDLAQHLASSSDTPRADSDRTVVVYVMDPFTDPEASAALMAALEPISGPYLLATSSDGYTNETTRVDPTGKVDPKGGAGVRSGTTSTSGPMLIPRLNKDAGGDGMPVLIPHRAPTGTGPGPNGSAATVNQTKRDSSLIYISVVVVPYSLLLDPGSEYWGNLRSLAFSVFSKLGTPVAPTQLDATKAAGGRVRAWEPAWVLSLTTPFLLSASNGPGSQPTAVASTLRQRGTRFSTQNVLYVAYSTSMVRGKPALLAVATDARGELLEPVRWELNNTVSGGSVAGTIGQLARWIGSLVKAFSGTMFTAWDVVVTSAGPMSTAEAQAWSRSGADAGGAWLISEPGIVSVGITSWSRASDYPLPRDGNEFSKPTLLVSPRVPDSVWIVDGPSVWVLRATAPPRGVGEKWLEAAAQGLHALSWYNVSPSSGIRSSTLPWHLSVLRKTDAWVSYGPLALASIQRM